MVAIDRVVLCFFVLFLSVYFLESIGGFYMTSAIVSIEKQFQIPSKISGMMVSAGDFGYIPSVVFVAYLGSKGNRARWIGGGCTLIAIANILISSSNFVFTGSEVNLNTSTVMRSLERNIHRLPSNVTLAHFLAEISPAEKRQQVRHTLEQLHGISSADDRHDDGWHSAQLAHCFANANFSSPSARPVDDVICDALYSFLHKHNAPSQSEVANWRLLSATSYAFCDDSLNSLRTMIDTKRCDQKLSNVAPTATIFLGLLILGVGRTMPFSLGLPLIDDNVRKSNLPLYFAGMFCIRIMGPMLGFLLGSFFNKNYYTLGKVPYGMTPRDPMWIGRWWAGFLLIGSVLLLPSLALFFFRNPKQKDSSGEENEEEGRNRPRGLALVDRHLEKGEDGEAIVPKGVLAKGSDFFQTMSAVIKQPVYRWTMVGRIIDVFAFKGFYIFMPKYLELQFGIPQYEVNRLMAIIGVATFAVGVMVGSLVMRVAKLQGRKAAAWVAMTGAIAACFSLLNSLVGCTSTMTALGDSLVANANSTSSCAVGCHCESAPLYPVCDPNGAVYYSPCHAGCQLGESAFSILETQKTPLFDSCLCSPTERVSREFCREENCRSKMYWYFTNVAIGGIIGGMGVVPGVLIMLRSVPPKHRSISLGFNGFLVSLLATLPSPIAWGTIIDNFCLFWTQKCGEKGACALYATDGLRFWLHFAYGGLRIVSLITDLFVIYHAVGLKLTDSDSQNANDGEGNGGGDEEATKGKKRSGETKMNNALEREQTKAFLDEEKESAADGAAEEMPNGQRKSASLPRETKTHGGTAALGQFHRRTVSRDMSAVATKLVPPVGATELQSFRKSSNQLSGPIAEF
ncbi:hypothetical protein niasHS_002789 [Heterodera schachtii]|uniref:Solute carrier organic anion transporter family member n=1 Tax=Heterodera schachtii TaxID=97005 RepID=A0ABD2K314_HETSC